MKIFKWQSSLRITLNTFCNLVGFIKAEIRFNKPNGTSGVFTAIVGDIENGNISYECKEGDLDMSGWWAFWAYVVFEDGRAAVGQTVKVYVWKQGSG